jgi:hypothetical protein
MSRSFEIICNVQSYFFGPSFTKGVKRENTAHQTISEASTFIKDTTILMARHAERSLGNIYSIRLHLLAKQFRSCFFQTFCRNLYLKHAFFFVTVNFLVCGS